MKLPGNITLPAARHEVATQVAIHLNLPIGDIDAAAIIIASDNKGFLAYSETEATLLQDVGEESGIHAIVPSRRSQKAIDADVPSIVVLESSSFLSSPLRSSWTTQVETMLGALEAKLVKEQEIREAKLRKEQEICEAKLRKEQDARFAIVEAALQEEKKFRILAEENYRCLLEEEKEERIEYDEGNKAHTTAVEEMVIHNDASFLAKIRLRVALENAEATLARETGLIPAHKDNLSASWAWRRKLKSACTDDIEERVKFSQKLIADAKPQPSTHVVDLSNSKPAMVLVSESVPSIRSGGNMVAHDLPSTKDGWDSLSTAVELLEMDSEREGMRAIAHFLQLLSPVPDT